MQLLRHSRRCAGYDRYGHVRRIGKRTREPADKLVNFLFRNDQRRQETKHAAATPPGCDDQSLFQTCTLNAPRQIAIVWKAPVTIARTSGVDDLDSLH